MSSASGYMGAKYVQEFGPIFSACHVPNVACHGVSISIVSISSVSCRVRIQRVSVSMSCHGHPDGLGRGGVAIDSSGDLLVADTMNHRVPSPIQSITKCWA